MPDVFMESGEIQRIIVGLVDALERHFSSWDDVCFIGIRQGGVHVARHIVKALKARGIKVPLGVLDISLYRDDLSRRLFYPEVKGTDIPFDVNERRIILVDDVLWTGRSARAAIDHIVDLGRPKRIYLLVLFDRGGREIPIQPDFVGKKVDIAPNRLIKLNVPEDSNGIGNVVAMELAG